MATHHFDRFPICKLIQNAKVPNFSELDEPNGLLVDLDLPIHITTNYDDFMERALESRGKKPIRGLARRTAGTTQ